MEWNFSLPDWEERIQQGRSLIPPLPLDEDEAQRAVRIFNLLRLPDVPGQPRMAESAGEWQRDIVRAIFGSLIDGVRCVPEVLCMVPKKSSKTTAGAAMGLTAMLMNERPRADFLIVGPTQEIADLAFQQASGMILADEFLTKRFHIAEHKKTITDRRNKARLKVKTFDMKVMTGSKPVFVLLDELHVMSDITDADRIIGQIRGGMLPNPESVLVMITTQSDRPPKGVFEQELRAARDVRDGKRKNGRVLPILYEFPPSMQRDGSWRDPENWPMVLPNLGRPVTLAQMIEAYEDARAKGEAEERRWASQHLNVEVGVALRSDGWAGAEVWDRGREEGLTLDVLLDRSDVVVVGFDGGGLDDLFGIGVVGRCATTKHWLAWAHALISPEGLSRRKANDAIYRELQDAGQLTVVDTLPDDIAFAVDLVRRINERGLLAQVGVDAAGIGGLVDALAEIGITQDDGRLVAVRQGIALMGAIKTVERKLVDGTFRHGGQKLLSWCVGNLIIVPTPTAMRVSRDESGYGKIDPLMALFDCAHLMSLNPEAIGASVFDQLAEQKAQSGAQDEHIGAEEMLRILTDPRHPRWEEMRRLYEANLMRQDELEDVY